MECSGFERTAHRGGIIAAAVCCLTLSACASAPSAHENVSDLDGQSGVRAHVERVFRFQNRVLDELLARVDDEEDERFAREEEALIERCRYLNESAAAMAAGEEPSFHTKMKVLETIDACDAQARAVSLLLGERATAEASSRPSDACGKDALC